MGADVKLQAHKLGFDEDGEVLVNHGGPCSSTTQDEAPHSEVWCSPCWYSACGGMHSIHLLLAGCYGFLVAFTLRPSVGS